jgi:hypothetical protein
MKQFFAGLFLSTVFFLAPGESFAYLAGDPPIARTTGDGGDGRIYEVEQTTGNWKPGGCPDGTFSSDCRYMVYRGSFLTSNPREEIAFSIWIGVNRSTGKLRVSASTGIPEQTFLEETEVSIRKARASYVNIDADGCTLYPPNNNFPKGSLTCRFDDAKARSIFNKMISDPWREFDFHWRGGRRIVIEIDNWWLNNFRDMFNTVIVPKL